MAEMITGKTLFKGNDHLDQLKEIMKVTGTPPAEFVQRLQSDEAKNYIKQAHHFLSSWERPFFQQGLFHTDLPSVARPLPA